MLSHCCRISSSVQSEQLNPLYFRELIQDLVIEKTVITKLNETAKQAREIGRQADLPERLEQAAARIREVKQPVKSLGNVRDGWADFQIRLQQYRGREFLGLRTGLRQLDDRTLGLRGLILLGAAPNVGKTALSSTWGSTSFARIQTPASCSSAWRWTSLRC